jgi:hypothetical protein
MALALVQMPTAQVEADGIGNGIVAGVVFEIRLDICRRAGPIAIAAVEDLVLEQHDGLAQSMLVDISHEFIELSRLNQRKMSASG